MKNKKTKVLIIVTILFCFGFILRVLDRKHFEINEQILDNEQTIEKINVKNKELQFRISELKVISQAKLKELSLWQRQHEILKNLIE